MGVLLVVGIWTARNAVVFGSFIPVATNAGYNLLLGNSENTVINAETTTNICVHWPDPSLTEVEQDAHFRNEALIFIRENPGNAFKLYIQKWANYFNFRNRLVTNAESSDVRDLLVLFTYGPLLLIAIGRVFFMKHRPLSKDEILFYVIYLGSAFVMAVFFSRIRFRLPFDLLLILIVALQSHYLIYKYLVKTK